MSALRWFAAARSAEQTLALWVATPPGSPCCAVKRDNTHSGLCLHVGEEGLSGNPHPNLESRLQLQFPHGCTDFLVRWHKSWLPTFPRGCAEPGRVQADAFLPSTRHKMCSVLPRGGSQPEKTSAALSEGAEFGICPVCTCLHYPQTEERAPEQGPEKGKERRAVRFALSR